MTADPSPALRSALRQTHDRYLAAVLRSDAAGAEAAIEAALQRSFGVVDLYLQVVADVQARLGDLWHEGTLNVAQVHLGTQIALRQLERLRQARRPRPPLGLRAVVTAVQGEQHSLGARIVADFLYLDGWDVDFLGADTPTPDLVDFVRQRRPDVVLLSVTMEQHLAQAAEAVAALHVLPEAPRVLVGGAAIHDRDGAAKRLGADGVAVDALEAIHEARRVAGAAAESHPLGELLDRLGRRIQEQRRARRLSQQQLADAAGLDRTYISAVEHGKQNLTIGAVLRLADALEVPLQVLLADSP